MVEGCEELAIPMPVVRKRNYKYRIYPTRKQARLLNRLLELHRGLYNAALQQRIVAWRDHKQTINVYAQGLELKEIRQEEEGFAWCNHNALKRTLRRLDKAFQAFFRRVRKGDEKPGFPKFKSRRNFNSIEYTYDNGLRLANGRVYVQEVGHIRMFQHRPIPEGAKIKAAVIKFERPNRWYAVFALELPIADVSLQDSPQVGIDMGLEYFCVLSTGELIENPRWFRAAEGELAILQKRRSRCKRGSKRYKELSRQIARLHSRVANKRHDFHNQLSTRLVREFGLIAIEDLNIKGLAKSHVRKSIGDAGWSQFLYMLEYKAEEHGSRFYRVNPRNTSQICSECGCVVKKELSERKHNCPSCGYIAHRDVNAAQVILKKALNPPDRRAA